MRKEVVQLVKGQTTHDLQPADLLEFIDDLLKLDTIQTSRYAAKDTLELRAMRPSAGRYETPIKYKVPPNMGVKV